MIKQYTKNDKGFVVTDENGETELRNYMPYSDMAKVFIIENRIELLDKIIEDLNNNILDNKERMDNTFKGKRYLQLFATELSLITAFASLCALTNHGDIASYGIYIGSYLIPAGIGANALYDFLTVVETEDLKKAYDALREKAIDLKMNLVKEYMSLPISYDNNYMANNSDIVFRVPSDEEFARETNGILNEEYKNNVWTKRLRKRNILG